MPNKKFINELKKLLRQRGKVPKVQIEYAKAEGRAMSLMYQITKPSEEVRSSNLRNLNSYIGEHAVNMIMEGRRYLVPLSISVKGN